MESFALINFCAEFLLPRKMLKTTSNRRYRYSISCLFFRSEYTNLMRITRRSRSERLLKAPAHAPSPTAAAAAPAPAAPAASAQAAAASAKAAEEEQRKLGAISSSFAERLRALQRERIGLAWTGPVWRPARASVTRDSAACRNGPGRRGAARDTEGRPRRASAQRRAPRARPRPALKRRSRLRSERRARAAYPPRATGGATARALWGARRASVPPPTAARPVSGPGRPGPGPAHAGHQEAHRPGSRARRVALCSVCAATEPGPLPDVGPIRRAGGARPRGEQRGAAPRPAPRPRGVQPRGPRERLLFKKPIAEDHSGLTDVSLLAVLQ